MAASALRLGPHLRELRIHLCQKSSTSAGVREFVEQHYVPLKKANPKFKILIRECSGVQPKLWARLGYAYGKEQSIGLDNQTAADVLKAIGEANAKSA